MTSNPQLDGTRIIVIIGPLKLGGAERQAILLARHLVHEQGADVEVWGHGDPGLAAELCDKHGVTWRSTALPVPWSLSRGEQVKRLVKFARDLRRARPDVILPFMFFQSVACGLVWRATGARLCIWNQRCEGRDRLGPRWERLAVRLTPRFVANSEHGADFLVKKLGVNRERLQVIHNGVELMPPQSEREGWRKQLGVSEDCFLACMVANLQQFKDHVTLLKAWRVVVDRLRASNRDAVLLLAGRFDETHMSLKALAYDLELGRTVRFLGSVKDISGLLSAVDLGVHSSVYEGCPNGVLECMAAGLGVVGTDYEGIREAVGESGYEFLAPPHDAAALAERILALEANPAARHAAGAANRRRIEAEFHPHIMYRKMLSLITDGLGERRMRSVASDSPLPPSSREASASNRLFRT